MDDMVIGVPFDDGYTYSETVCLDLEGCYTVTVTGDDSYGASNEASFDVVSGDSELLSVSSTNIDFCLYFWYLCIRLW